MGPPPGADRRDRAGLRPARDAHLAAAGQVHQIGPMFRYDRPRRDGIASSGSSTSRRSATPVRRRCRDRRARAPVLPRGRSRPSVEVQLNSIGDPACRPATREPDRYYRTQARPARRRARPPRAQPAAPARLEMYPAMAAINAEAPRMTDRLCAPCAEHFGGGPRPPGRPRRRVSPRTRARARPRLLHPDRVRVLRPRSGGPAAGHRRRGALRRPDRVARRSPDAGNWVRHRARPAGPRARGGRPRGRAGAGAGRGSWRAPTRTTRSRGW